LNQRNLKFAVFFLALLALALFLPFFGSETFSWHDLASPASPGYRVLWELRLPRLLLTLVVGGSLAMLGGTYQILFHNPLAEPYLLGISSAVTLGVALGEIFAGAAPFSYAASAFGLSGALLTTLLLAALALSPWGDALDRIVLFGTGLNFLLSSTLLLVLSYHNQQMGAGGLRWLFGQIPWMSGRESLVFAAVCAPFLAVLLLAGRSLDALGLGDTVARTLGFSPARTRGGLVVLTSFLLAVIVSFTGSIGFVGLVIPHTVRLIFRPAGTRALFVLSFALGAVFLAASDVLSRAILPPFEFPIGVITTVVGAPVFLWLLWKRH